MHPQRINGKGNQFVVISDIRQADVSRRYNTRICVDDGFTSVEVELNPAQFKVLLTAINFRMNELDTYGRWPRV